MLKKSSKFFKPSIMVRELKTGDLILDKGGNFYLIIKKDHSSLRWCRYIIAEAAFYFTEVSSNAFNSPFIFDAWIINA